MKTKIIIILLMGTIINTNAQISKSAMLEKVKALHPNNRNSATMDTSGYEKKEWVRNAWVIYYRHGYTVVSKTNYPGITHKYTGSLRYIKNGSNYAYDTNMVGDGVYLGVPSPDKSQILKFIQGDYKNFLGDYHYQSIVGEVPQIELLQENTWQWKKLNMLEIKVKATFNEKISAYDTEKSEHIFQVTLYSDAYKSPWNRFIAREIESEKKQLGRKKYSYEELNNLKTLEQIDTEKQASSKMSGMPEIQVPVFATDQELFAVTHKMFLQKDPQTIKAYLYKIMAKSCKEDGSDVVLTYLTQQWFDKIINNLAIYKKTHFEKPAIKHYQPGLLRYFDKENRRVVDMEAVQENSVWKLYSIRYYPANEEDVKRMENM